MTTVAKKLHNDPQIIETKKALLDGVLRHSATITSIKPADPALAKTYEETIQHFNTLRSAPLWYPYLGSGIGNGALVELEDGSVKYDFITGIGVHFGHSHPAVIKAAIDAAVADIVMQGNLLQNRDSVELSDMLVKASGLDHMILSTTGAMAIENGLKILFQKKAPAHRILAFERCFMGRTLALSTASDKPGFRDGLPLNLDVDYVPFFDAKDPEGSQKRAVEVLKKALWRYPKQHACMCFELIQGESGYYPGTTSFFKALIDVLKENDIKVFVDEVQTFARTEKLFAYQTFGLENDVDLVTIGKLFQAGATLFRNGVKPRPALISQTYTASTSSIKAAYAIVHSLLHEGYFGADGKNMKLRHHFVTHLEALQKRHPDLISGPFGMGLMIAFTPYQGDKERVMQFAHRLFKNGVIAFIAGENPMRIRFLVPAGGVTFNDIDTVSEIIEKTLVE